MVHALFEDNGQYFQSLTYLFGEITKTHPELITVEHVDYIFKSMKTYPNTHNELNHVFISLQPVASVHPQGLDKHRDEFLRLITEEQSISVYLCFEQYLLSTAILYGEKTADEHITLVLNLVRSIPKISSDLTTMIFHTCQVIGLRYKTVLASRRDDFVPFQSYSMCQTLIDLIDGNKISEENQAAINRTVEEMAQIEQRVVRTEQKVENVTKLVKRQELNVSIPMNPLRTISMNLPHVQDDDDIHPVLLAHCRCYLVNSFENVPCLFQMTPLLLIR